LRPVEQLLEVCPELRPDASGAYRGLEVFEERHADVYFGREAATEALLDRLVTRDFVAVVGVSGSGKSSLVRAGLAKGLAARQIPGLALRPRCLMTPGPAPLLNLLVAIARLPATAPQAVSRALGLSETALPEAGALRETAAELARLPAGRVAAAIRRLMPGGLIVIVDQFERLYTECSDAAMREQFTDALLALRGGAVTTLITLRADFYGLALAHAGLAHAIEEGQITLLPMSETELRHAIEEPAHQRNRVFEPELARRLIADISGRAGDLPCSSSPSPSCGPATTQAASSRMRPTWGWATRRQMVAPTPA
jgi:hypothetical protein